MLAQESNPFLLSYDLVQLQPFSDLALAKVSYLAPATYFVNGDAFFTWVLTGVDNSVFQLFVDSQVAVVVGLACQVAAAFTKKLALLS